MAKQQLTYKTLILPVLLFSVALGNLPVCAKDSLYSISSESQSNYTQIVQQAQQSYQAQDYQQAVALWQQAAEIFRQRGDKLNQAMALSNLSLTYQQLGYWKPAQQALETSLKLLDNSSNQDELIILAQTLDIEAQLYKDIGQPEKALKNWIQAEKIYQKLNQITQREKNLINQADALYELGFLPQSCQTILEVLAIKQENCNLSELTINTILKQDLSETKIQALISLGGLLRSTAFLQKSEIILSNLILLVQKQYPELYLKTLLNLADTEHRLFSSYQELKDQDQIQLYQNKTLNNYQALLKINKDNPVIQSHIQINFLKFLIDNKNWNEAETIAKEVNNILTQVPLNRKNIYATVNYARQLVCLKAKNPNCLSHNNQESINTNSIRESISILENTLENIKINQDLISESYLLGNLGILYKIQGNREVAQKTLEKALNIAVQNQADNISYQWYWQLGRMAKEKGETEKASTYYNQAFTILNKLRFDLVALSSEVQFSFRESVEPLYREYVDLLLTENPNQNQLTKAIEVMEKLKIAELNNFFRDNCLEGKIIQENLGDNIDSTAAVFYPIILSDRIEVIVSIAGKEKRNYKTYINQEASEQQLREIVNIIGSIEVNEPPKESLKKWYDILITPIEQELQRNNIKTLIFVSDGLLRNIPLSALYDGNRYLLEKYGVAIAPSLKLINPAPFTAQKLKLFAAGLTEARQGFSPLPGVAKELENLKEEVSMEVLLLNESFSQSNFEKKFASSSFPIIHLATHGEFNSTAENTFILAWDDKINVYKLDQLLRHQNRRKNPVELLVLSACETAKGDDRSALGLAGVAVRAGARSTVASLWQVSDESTQMLMTSLYEELARSQQKGGEKITKAEALRRAQLRVLQEEKFSNPFFWSAFILVGNWF